MRRLAALGLSLLLGGCQTGSDIFSRLALPEVSNPSPPAVAAARPQVTVAALDRAEPAAKVGYAQEAKKRPVINPAARQVSLNFDNAGLDDVIRSVMKEVVGQTLLVEPGVYPVVSFALEKPTSSVEVVELLQVLAAQNKARLFFADGVYQLTHDVPDTSNQRVIRLQHRRPSDFKSFGTVASGQGASAEAGLRVLPDDATRQVVLSGPPSAVAAVGQAIGELDLPAFDGITFRWVASREPRQVAEALSKIAPMSATVIPYGEGLLMSGVASDLGRVEKLISLLNSHAETAQFVYDVKSAPVSVCKEVATAFTDPASSSVGMFSPVMGYGPYGGYGAGPAAAGAVDADTRSLMAALGSYPASQPALAGSSSSPRRMTVVASDGRCVLRGQRQDVLDALEMLRLLDRKQPVVMFDAALFEVKLTDELRYGVRWFFDRGNMGIRASDFPSVAETARNFAQGGFAVLPYSDWRIAVDALRGKTTVNVLAQPHITVDSGQEGKLQVGDQVPVASATSQSEDTGRTTTSIQYRDIGVILRVKPQARPDGDLELTVNVEVTGAQKTTTSGIDSPTISRRGADAVVTVADGQSILLGGLLREAGEDGVTGVPLLSDIPGLGELFKQTSHMRERQEMALVLTPHIVDASEISARARSVLERIRQLHQVRGG